VKFFDQPTENSDTAITITRDEYWQYQRLSKRRSLCSDIEDIEEDTCAENTVLRGYVLAGCGAAIFIVGIGFFIAGTRSFMAGGCWSSAAAYRVGVPFEKTKLLYASAGKPRQTLSAIRQSN